MSSWLKSFSNSLSRSSFSQDDTSPALSPAKQTSPGKRILRSLKKSSSVSSLRSQATIGSTTPPCSPSKSLRRSRSSVRSILKKSSVTNLAEIATPSRSVKFTASTSEAREHKTPVPASYHFGDEAAEAYFYKTDDWTGQAEVIVDSPPRASGEDDKYEQEGDLLDSFALDQMSPPKTAHSSPGTPAPASIPRSQSFLNRLKAAIPSPENSLLAASTGSTASLPGVQTNEWSNLFDNSLPDQRGSSTLADSTSSEREPSSSTAHDLSRRTVMQSPDQSRARSTSPDHSIQPETSFITPGKAALDGIQTSRSFNSLASYSTPGSSPEKGSGESRRSLNTKVNLLKRDGERVCDEFGVSSPEERYSTPSTSKRRRSSLSPVKVAGLPFRPPPSQSPIKVPVGEESSDKVESIIEHAAEKSIYFSPMPAEPLPDVGPSPTKSSFASLSPSPSGSPPPAIAYPTPNQSSSSMDITDCASPSKSAPFSADTSLQDLFSLFSTQHSTLTTESATHRTLVLDLLKQLQKDSEAKDKRLINLKKQVDLAEQGWSEAIEEAGRWEEEQLANASPDVDELQGQKKDLEIRLEHAQKSCREALEKVEQMDGMGVELVRLRKEIDTAVADGREREVQMQRLLDGKEDEVNEVQEAVEELERRIEELQSQVKNQSEVVRQKNAELNALQQQQDTFEASRIETETEEAKQSQWKITDLLSQVAVLRKQLETAETDHLSTKNALAEKTQAEAEHQALVTGLQDQLAEAQSSVEQYESTQAELDQVRSDLEAEIAEKEELVNQLNSNTEALEVVMAEKDNLQKELRDSDQRCSRSEEHLRKAQDDIATLEDGTTGHLDRVERSQSKIDQLESGQDRLLNNLHDLEEQLEAKDGQLRDLTEVLKSERKDAANSKQRNERDVEKLKQELVALRSAPQTCAECASREGNASELQKEIERLSKAVAKMRFEASDREAKINRLGKAKADLKEDKEGLSLALEAKQQELSMLKRRRESRDPSVMPFTTAKSQRILRSHPSAQSLQEAETPMPNAPKMQASTAKRDTLQPRRISFGQTIDQTPTLAKTGLNKKASRGSIASVYGDAPRRPQAEKENAEDFLGQLPDVPRARRSRSTAMLA